MKRVLFLAFVAVLFAACSQKVHNVKVFKDNNNTYTGAYVDFAQNTEQERYLYEQIDMILKGSKLYGKDLKIECEILSYDAGNRALRYTGLVSFGAGSATSKINVRLSNENNETIATFTEDAILTGGLFGGASKDVFYNAAMDIVKFIQKNYIKKTKMRPSPF